MTTKAWEASMLAEAAEHFMEAKNHTLTLLHYATGTGKAVGLPRAVLREKCKLLTKAKMAEYEARKAHQRAAVRYAMAILNEVSTSK